MPRSFAAISFRCMRLLLLMLATLPTVSLRASTNSLQTMTAAADRVTFANSLAPLPVTAGAKVAASGAIITDVNTLSTAQLAVPQEFSVALGMRNLAEFQVRVANGERVPYEEVQAKYLPLQADYDRVLAWLKSEGFTPAFNDTSRLSIFVQGTPAQIQQSFAVTMQSVTVEGVAYPAAVTAPSLPASVGAGVLGVNGLQPYLQMRPFHVAAKPKKVSDTIGARPDATVSASSAHWPACSSGRRSPPLVRTTSRPARA